MRSQRAALLFVITAIVAVPAQADEKEAMATIDKAIKAMGGEEKLASVKAFSARGKGKITVEGNDLEFTFEMTTQGNDKYRSTYEVDAGGTKFAGGTVLDGEKGWRKQGDEIKKLDNKELALERRNAYLDVIPVLVLPLKGKDFKLDSTPDEKVGDKAVAVIRVTGPEGKDFTLYFDKESGLPLKMSGPVADQDGVEEIQETLFEDYKDYQGIKVSTSARIRRGGKKYIEIEELEFKALGEVEQGTFAEPK